MSLRSVDYAIGKLLEIITTLCLAVTVIITFLQVIFRYVLTQPLSWSQEAVMIAFVYSVLFGSVLAIKNIDHLTVDLFENPPVWFSWVLKVIEFFVVGVFIVVLFYYGYSLVMDNLRSGQVLGILPVKKAYVYMAIPVSAIFMFYFHVRKVFR